MRRFGGPSASNARRVERFGPFEAFRVPLQACIRSEDQPQRERVNDVSVIVVNWNAGDLLLRCLTALEKQTEQCREVIVVDNDSTDGSISAIEKRFPHVRIIRQVTNAGFARGSNVGADSAKGEWIALLNPDAFPEPGWLGQSMRAAREHPEITCFGSLMLSADRPGVLDGTGDVYHVSGRVWRAGHGQAASRAARCDLHIFSPCAAAALYKRDVFVEAGGFDESFFCYLEDVDLGFRLRLLGHKCMYVPSAVVQHVGSATTGGQHSDFSVYHGHRNLVWTYFKNMPWPLFWLYLPQHLLLNLITIVWFALRGQARVILRAKRDALMGLPRVLRQRRPIQRRRTVSSWEIRRTMSRGLLAVFRR